MSKKIWLLLLISFAVLELPAQKKKLFQGKKITRSVKIKKGVYRLEAPGGMDASVILIEGNNITVDFREVLLHGNKENQRPDAFAGIGIWIKGGKNITLRNLNAHGFKVAIRATNVEGLTLDHCDLSYNYRPYLNSTQEKEDISDWMSYHQNDKNEWLRYGAAIYLENCDRAEIKYCRVTGGQNALMMKDCDNGRIYNNDFSFNSGIGIGMYRCNDNTIAYNKINFNVRGYSHGVYNRGQDSAGILVYEQSNRNFFFKNAVTHGGDGFFLWAGQITMDNGYGGCNDNVLSGNDFSYAPTNGIEVTFSRNRIYNNRIFECDHGIWGGYSFGSIISGNKFRNNRIDVAIEHGQDNQITFNIFQESKEAIRLWSRPTQPADWGYAKARDTRSRNYKIVFNNFLRNGIVYNIKGTQDLNIFENIYDQYQSLYSIDGTVTGLDTGFNAAMDKALSVDTTEYVPEIPDPQDPFKGGGLLAGRKNIRMTAWGPYDYRYPLVWLENPVDSSGKMQFTVLGPAGQWKLKSAKGVTNLSATEGAIPGSFTCTKEGKGKMEDIRIELAYTGPAFTDPFGRTGNTGHLFTFEKYFMPIDFEVRWYAYDPEFHDPLKSGSLFPPNARVRPVKTEKTTKLEYAWWGGIKAEGQTYEKFITVAEGKADMEAGTYEFSITWDDAVRLYVDGKMIVDEWNPSLYKFDESPNKKVQLKLEAGVHHFQVEHVEKGGFATLNLKVLRKS